MSEIRKIHNRLINKEISAVEVTKEYIGNIERTSEVLGTYISTTFEEGLKAAELIDKKISQGEEISLLGGIPMGIKDNISSKDVMTTCASKILEGYKPVFDATVLKNLKNQGGILLGKCNMDEFAMGSSSENSAYKIVKNPYNLNHVPGGSSGGSAATVAANEVVFSLGSDTGGSVRQPAGFCSVVGMKPTYGSVSRYGLIAYGSSLDQIGPLTKTVEDCAIVMDNLVAYDKMDSTSVKGLETNYAKLLNGDVKGLKIGVPKEYMGGDPVIVEKINAALKKYEEMGAIVEEMSLPHTEYALSVYYIIASAEVSSNLSRFDGVRFGQRAKDYNNLVEMMDKTRGELFGKEVKNRIMLGTYALSSGYYDAYYLKALKARTILKREFDEAFKKYDVLITPIAPTLPYKIGENVEDQMAMYLGDICTVTINLVGIPGLTIPCGFHEGLPIGMQILGKPFSEQTLLNVGKAFEDNTDFHSVKPKMEVK